MSEKNDVKKAQLDVKRAQLYEVKHLYVDGYNVINQVNSMKSNVSLEESRRKLIDKLIEYQSFTHQFVTVVFDAHQVKGTQPKIELIEGVKVVYTKERQTADSYIEIEVAKLSKNPRNLTRVVTGDWAEQQAVLGSGALRVTVLEFLDELKQVTHKIERVRDKQLESNTLGAILDKDSLLKLKKMIE